MCEPGGEENRLCEDQGVRRIGCVWARGGGEYPVCGTTVV